jgi:tetratricopeptide (TPR) repeat protein
MLALMNPPNVQDGVKMLEDATENHESIPMMLDLADAYCTIFKNDSFRPDIEKAEEWYIKALGKYDSYSPFAFTRYGDFLMNYGRYDEAKPVYAVAAVGGHPRGEYEYANILLNETSTKNEFDHENTEKALKVLCGSSRKGFHAPSYTLLVKTLVDIFQKDHGTVYVTGKSPLPRILQILRLALKSEHFYGFPYYSIERRQWEKETSDLLELYEKSLTKCSNCGQKGSQENPLRFCEGCDGSVAYCSNICQRRDFRDGHKFDCCSPKHLFDFDSLRVTLPWVSTSGSKRHENDPLPRLRGRTGRSLLQMVEDDTDEIYGEEDQDYDETILHNMMFRMRKNLETYLSKELNDFSTNKNLHSKIIDFGKKYQNHYSECANLVKAMHFIRELGNNAVHYNDIEEKKLTQKECEYVVQSYRDEKERYEKFKKQSKNSLNVQEEKKGICNDLTTAIYEDSTENDNKIASVEKDCVFAKNPEHSRVLNSTHVTQEPNQKKQTDSALVKKNPEDVGNLTCSNDVIQTPDKKKKKR